MEESTENGKDSVMALHDCSGNLLCSSDASVKKLQSVLFPITPRKSYSAESYLSNTFLKKVQLRDDDEEEVTLDPRNFLKSKDSRELIYNQLTPIENVNQPPRWPAECQVVDERIKHIPFAPCPPEPYYQLTGEEVQPKPIGDEAGIIVYQYSPISAVNYFCRSSIGGSKYLLPTCPSPEEESLRFESRFESGNLAKAIKITASYYELYLRTDLYTNRHMQWFYFRITNMKKGSLYRFSIVNFTKEDSLYCDGMRPLMYSEKDAQLYSVGWRRCGANITYYCNDNVTPDDPDQIRYFTLTFTIEFPHDYDTVYLAHSYPYTYTDLQDHLMEITTHPVKSSFTTLRLLCKTLAGNNVYYITVTTPQTSEDAIKKKKAIVITARVHPGETPSSWMMHGFLDYLTSDCAPAKELRDNFIFKLVPMLNPDGVIVGNNRCSLSGKDLNRQYRTVIRETYPSIWYTKLMIRRLIEECGVAMYCDLHAHSKKHNIFIFGCENRRTVDKKLYEQVFPLMLHKNSPEKFSFQNCKFKIQKCKEGTGRVVMWMMGIVNSFTMEASFGGSTLGNRTDTHFNTMDFEQMGKIFCQTLLDFYDDDPRKERLRSKIMSRLMKEGSSADEPANICISDYSTDDGDSSCSEAEDNRVEIEKPPPKIFRIPAPPPSPVKIKRCLIPKLNVPKIHLKSPTRKPLEVCKASFGFPMKQSFSSDNSSSDSEVQKEKRTMRKKKKKKKKKAPKKQAAVDFSDNDAPVIRDFALINLPIPSFKPKSANQNDSRYPRYLLDSKRTSQDRISEVQARLMSLKNKLWFGIGDVNSHSPISWGNPPNNKMDLKHRKQEKRKPSIKKITSSIKADSKEKPSKKQKESLKRQTAIEFTSLGKSSKLRKSKSLTDNTKKEQKFSKFINLGNVDTKILTEIGPSSSKLKQKKSKIKPKVSDQK